MISVLETAASYGPKSALVLDEPGEAVGVTQHDSCATSLSASACLPLAPRTVASAAFPLRDDIAQRHARRNRQCAMTPQIRTVGNLRGCRTRGRGCGLLRPSSSHF